MSICVYLVLRFDVRMWTSIDGQISDSTNSKYSFSLIVPRIHTIIASTELH